MIEFVKFGIPALMLIIGMAACIQELLFSWFAREAEGEVIGLHEYVDSDGDTMWQADIRWQSDDGAREFRDRMAFGWRAFQPGDRVSILYPGGHPERARIRRSGPVLIFLAIAMAGATTLAIALGEGR